ncbi:hypothetical protein B0H14DRAFT_3460989 [Mycena olivaceomarginata]|nr:hypothetical protein B0H14DRAFT_3460989 [Mycena olivaceomarginata]
MDDATSPSFIWGLFVRELFETSAAIILYGLYVNLFILAMYTLFAAGGLPDELGCWRRPGFSSDWNLANHIANLDIHTTHARGGAARGP